MARLEFSKSTPMTRKSKPIPDRIEKAAGLPRFDVAALRDAAGAKVFDRGTVYFEDDQVEIITINDARILTQVTGSEVYRCELVGTGKNFSGECSCPAFSDWGFCKHLVATALAANSLDPAALEQASNRFAKIREHLRSKGVEGLVEMVVGLAERDSSLLGELEFSAAVATADDTTLFAQFKKAITGATRTHGFVEYHEMLRWVQEIDSVLDRIESLLDGGRAELVLKLLDHFFTRMDDALNEIDDSDGGGGGVYARACEIHLAACREAKPDPITLARDLFAREVDSDLEFFDGASEAYEDVLGDAGLAEYRRLANEAWQKIKPLAATKRRVEDEQFGARYALGAILERFARRDGDVDGVIAIRARDLSTAHDYLAIAELCLEHARGPEALKWAEEGLWQFEDSPDERLMLFVSDLYRRTGREQDADKLLWRAFERRPSIELYDRLKSAAGPERMSAEAVRERAFAWLRTQIGRSTGSSSTQWSWSTELFVRLAMTEGLLTDAWMVIKSHGCSDLLREQLAEVSEQSHPVEALKTYTDGVERMLRVGGQINYDNAYRTIERMRRIRDGLGEAVQHAAYLADLKSRHKAKRNFMKLFTAAGA
jgi:hypothetical protein